MTTHTPIIGGMAYTIHFEQKRGGSVIGSLEEEGEIVFESVFPSYRDAYDVLMEMDLAEFVSRDDATRNSSVQLTKAGDPW